MGTVIINGYKVEHTIDPEKARQATSSILTSEFCVSTRTARKHSIMTINNYLRIRFKYEGMKHEFIEIKKLKKKKNK